MGGFDQQREATPAFNFSELAMQDLELSPEESRVVLDALEIAEGVRGPNDEVLNNLWETFQKKGNNGIDTAIMSIGNVGYEKEKGGNFSVPVSESQTVSLQEEIDPIKVLCGVKPWSTESKMYILTPDDKMYFFNKPKDGAWKVEDITKEKDLVQEIRGVYNKYVPVG